MPMNSTVIKELLENGVHFGHQTNKWNPKMKEYIFGEKSGIYIIDLEKTEVALAKAMDFLQTLAASGKTVLFAGTKKQAQDIIKSEAKRCSMFYVEDRWLGGCLTNFETIKKSVQKLNYLQELKTGEHYQVLPKKEKAHIDREEYKLLKNLEGIREMNSLPHCLVVVDAEVEKTAIREAIKIGIPVIGLVDTNCDPSMIKFPIPGNDDAIRSIKYIVSKLADAVEKGVKEYAIGSKIQKTGKPDVEPEKPKAAPQAAPRSDVKPAPVEVEAKKEDILAAPDVVDEKPVEDELLDGDIKLG